MTSTPPIKELAMVENPPEVSLAEALARALATLDAVYQWVDKVDAAGGPTCIAGVASANAMHKSLKGQRARMEALIMAPGRAALARQGTSS